jgi:1-deoxy-D-xylulose-5-phosphate synthase
MKVQSPAALKTLPLDSLRELAEDIRQTILAACLKNGGHLGASLGTVELAIALHREFDSPAEPIVWDVGHQAYAHKLITGRWDRFDTLRTSGGISGFLSRQESEHDVFGAGHSSTALSAALAMAWASGRDAAAPPRWTVAVVGDGGMTAGIALEALNNIRSMELGPLLVVLNDNQMSIGANVGAIPAILSAGEAPELFRLFGMDYVGPIDGHDLGALLGVLQGIRGQYAGRPVLLHVHTQKGKGYSPAEEHPAVFHGISPVQAKVPEKGAGAPKLAYSDAFGQALCELAEKDPRVVAITAAMPDGTGLVEFARRFPDRFFDVGIAEPHAVTFAAGLATQGFRPVVAIYSTFLQRALDSIIHDTALQGLGITLAIDRAGLVGADGPTHHGAFDLAYLGAIPGLAIDCPASLGDLRAALASAVSGGGLRAIRYPRGSGPAQWDEPAEGGLRFHQRTARPRLIVAALGASAQRAQQAWQTLDPPVRGDVALLGVVQAKPLPPALLTYLEEHANAPVLTVEDGSLAGGFGQALAAELSGRPAPVGRAGLAMHFVPHGAVTDLEAREGLSAAGLLQRMTSLLSRG